MMVYHGSHSEMQFHRLSKRSFAWAQFFLKCDQSQGPSPEGLTNAAVQHAAMAVECGLKALILDSTSRVRREVVQESFKGSQAHNLQWLKDCLRVQGITIPKEIIVNMAQMGSWDHNQRYDLHIVSRSNASNFLARAKLVLDWVGNRMSP